MGDEKKEDELHKDGIEGIDGMKQEAVKEDSAEADANGKAGGDLPEPGNDEQADNGTVDVETGNEDPDDNETGDGDPEEDDPELERKSLAGKAIRIFLSIMLLIFLLGTGTVAGVALFAANALKPMEPSDIEKRIVIPKGVTSAGIAEILEEEGLIRSGTIFRLYLKHKNQGHRFQAGEYAMKPGISLDEIIDKLNRGETIQHEMVRFTVPEGFHIKQIADKLAKEHSFDKEVFLSLAQNPQTIAGKFSEHIPDNKELKFPLEGYLFPETYEFKKDITEQEIFRRMVEELERKLSLLPDGWERQLDKLKINFHQMMTIASLVEREVVVEAERPIVAGIIYNRLKLGWKLQVDATVQYLFDVPKEKLFYGDLEVESPYNTYLHEGLPPGPIASPGLHSIKAALYPDETKYLFYVTKKDGTQEHYFAVTYEEHQRNKTKSEKTAGSSNR
jgi:UPF0755 protein